MSTQHTPGPWMTETRRGRAIVIDADGNEVCEAYAGARLIAAAPDLLAALRGMVLCADVRGDAEPLDAYQTRAAMLPQQIARARAAIARATRCDA